MTTNMNLGVSQEDLDAAQLALGQFIAQEPDFWNTSPNVTALKNHLRQQEVPLAMWCDIHIWAAAYWACKKAGLLEYPPPPETSEERVRRLQAQDRADGSRAGNKAQPGEKPSAKLKRLYQETVMRQKAADAAFWRKLEESKAAKDVKENPHKYAPDYKTELTAEQMKSLAAPVLKYWSQKHRAYLDEQAAIERETKRKHND